MSSAWASSWLSPLGWSPIDQKSGPSKNFAFGLNLSCRIKSNDWVTLQSVHPIDLKSYLMKNKILILLCGASLASCAGGPNAQTGTVLGALGGAAVGGIIGNQSGRGLEGAAIGAAAGGIGGNMIGNAQDQRNAQRYYQNQPPPPPPGGYYRY